MLPAFRSKTDSPTLLSVDIGPSEIMIILVLVLVVFGGSQLPKFARNLGKAQQEFKSALASADKDDDAETEQPSPDRVPSDSD